MSVDTKNNILYIGMNQEFADATARILNYHRENFQLNTAASFADVQNITQAKPVTAFLFDADLLHQNGKNFFEQILQFAQKIPVILVVDKEQEDLGHYAMEKGAYDYIVRVNGALTAIPFTLDRALERKVDTEKIHFDFKVTPDIEERISVFEINESGRFISFDDQLSEILGQSAIDFYKSYLVDFLAEDDREKFYFWRASMKKPKVDFLIQTEVIHRDKGLIPVELQLQPYTNPEALFSGFRGCLKILVEKPQPEKEMEAQNLLPFLRYIYQLNSYLRQDLNQLFLMKLAEIPQQQFHFLHVSLYLYCPTKNRYEKELSIGDEIKLSHIDLRSDHFATAEIEHLFAKKQFIQFVHQSVLKEEERQKIYGSSQFELFQEKSLLPGEDWQVGDRLFLNLKSSDDRTSFGFILLENPESGKIPAESIKKQAEAYSIFAASLFEAQQKTEGLETKYKQLKQIFTILETYAIDLPLDGLLREIVWTIKFSLGFNLAIFSVLSKSTRRLHLKSIALDEKEKASILSRLHFSLEEITPWLMEKFRISHSYLITEQKSSISLIKRVYGLPLAAIKNDQFWQYHDMLIVPLRTRNKNIVGFFILDDPINKQRPSLEMVQIIEKIAKLVAVTIENKITYTQLKSKYLQVQMDAANKGVSKNDKTGANKIKQIFKKINFNM